MKKLKAFFDGLVYGIGVSGLLHIFVSAVIVAAFGWIKPYQWAGLIALVLGIFKEVVDIAASEDRKQTFKDSMLDLFWDVIGISVGYFVVGNIVNFG